MARHERVRLRRVNTVVCVTITISLILALIAFGFAKLDMHLQKNLKAMRLSRNPRAYVEELYVPGLDGFRIHNRYVNSSIIIGLEFKREEALPGDVAMYSDLNIHLYYGPGEEPSYPVANRTVPPFRMGVSRRVQYTAVVEAPRLPWRNAFNKISGGSTVLLRLVLFGKFNAQDCRDADSYYRCSNKFEWLEFQSEAEVWVDASAHMISNTPIIFN